MPSQNRGPLASDTELRQAGRAGLRGAAYGAALFGMPAAVALLVANQVHPGVKRLTFQFKLFLQMSAMTVGSIIHADRALREFEKESRRIKARAARQRSQDAVWRKWENDVHAELQQQQQSQLQSQLQSQAQTQLRERKKKKGKKEEEDDD